MCALLASAPPVRRPRFHTLRVAQVERLTDEAVAVTFDVPEELRDEYAYQPGQHLTLRATIDGEDVRQSYSICQPRSSRASGRLRVASAMNRCSATTAPKVPPPTMITSKSRRRPPIV